MAVRRSYTAVRKKPEPKTFSGKYKLSRVAGLKEDASCFVIPLDLNNGYASIPVHTVRKNSGTGFLGSNFSQVNIRCHSFDPATGEPLEEEALCCKLARLEYERKEGTDNSPYRCITFQKERVIIPVLVLGTVETDSTKKPTIQKISLDGIGFSFIDMARKSYEDEWENPWFEKITNEGLVDDFEDLAEEEKLAEVIKRIQRSIIKITGVKAPGIAYKSRYDFIDINQESVAKKSGEDVANQIKYLIKMVNNGFDPEKLEKLFKKYPVLKEINNQIIDYLTLFDAEVDSIAADWDEAQLQEYYEGFVKRQEQTDAYKDVNAKAAGEDEDDDDVVIASEDDEDEIPTRTYVEKESDEDVEGDEFFDSSFDDEPTPPKKPVKAEKPAKTEKNYNYSTAELESTSVSMKDMDDDVSEDDFAIDDEDDDFGGDFD